MNIFKNLVDQVLEEQPELALLRPVVEKELLHHDILRIMHESGLLQNLTFIGGTCLRLCYGSNRLSEDLDFTGGSNFNKQNLQNLASQLETKLFEKYELSVQVSEPVKDKKNVDTWKIKIQTSPEKKHLPAQRINIDICAVPSYDAQLEMLINHYNVDMGTFGLSLITQSCEEIFIDKILALALRPNRIKHRDLWDILWLHQKNISPAWPLLIKKLQDRKLEAENFMNLLNQRTTELQKDNMATEFSHEMTRFLPNNIIKSANMASMWQSLVNLVNKIAAKATEELS